MDVEVRGKKYKVIKDYGETVSTIDFGEIVTDYYDNFDYIVGDWAYGKVRLKGFYNVEDYINNSCAYGCKHFILEKIKNKTVEKKD